MTPTPQKSVRLRLAPSPTGHLHLGTARTALFNWLIARQNAGVFILRIEDTDRERSLKTYEEELIGGLEWLGLEWDEGPTNDGKEKGGYGPYHQSKRGPIYKKYLEQLLEEKKAYYCYCSKDELEAHRQSMLAQGLPPVYSGHCRDLGVVPREKESASIRFKMPQTEVEFKDLVRGKIVFNAGLFGDVVIAKTIETPLYNLAVVIDDYEMKISHVVRGEDHLTNTPKQILFQRALGFDEPIYAHLPLILGSDRSKLSKRYAEASLLGYRDAGYLPPAMINFLALLGWHPQNNQEVYSLKELVAEFNAKRIQKGGAMFSKEKLDWLNSQHLKKLTDEEIFDCLKSFLAQREDGRSFLENDKLLKKIIHIERERLKTLEDFPEIAGFFLELPEYDKNLLIWKNESPSSMKTNLDMILDLFNKTNEKDFRRDILLTRLQGSIEEKGSGPMLWPLRVALSGRTASPDPLEIIEVLGKDETMRRVSLALHKLSAV